MQELNLPSSKSISNRLLIIQYLSKSNKSINNLSQADDTKLLQNALKQIDKYPEELVFTNDAGTVTRFIISLLALKQGIWSIDASTKMRERPIKPLLEALENLGAEIKYLEIQYRLPIKVNGGKLIGGKTIKVNSRLSSQFLSSLLLVSPYIEGGLIIDTSDHITSKPYLQMTIDLIKEFGAKLEQKNSLLIISPSKYEFRETYVENDWSSACFAYEKLCIMRRGEIFIKNLHNNSLQADSIAQKYFSYLGIKSKFIDNRLVISYNEEYITKEKRILFDIKDCPDIFPSLLVSSLFSGKKVSFSGIESLKYKESNRIESMMEGLGELGAKVYLEDDRFIVNGFNSKEFVNKPLVIKTYDDHRIAMAFGVLSLKYPNIQIDNMECVSKSFPGFWENIYKII
ncbi:MAG: hypothetical protein WC135_09550 [Bacteroidales bacterium]